MPSLRDAAFEAMVIIWIVAGPLAITRWVDGFEDPVSWAAFIAGVIGVLVGWVVIAPYELAKKKRPESGSLA